MPSLADIDHSHHYNLFTGEPGVRKSTAALSYPLPQYWFSYDQKMNGLVIPMRNWGIDAKLVDYDDYDNWDMARAKLERFRSDCKYKTIIIDSITSCADYMLRQVVKAKSGQNRKSGAEAGKMIGGIPVNEMEDFNAESAGLTELIALTKDIKKYHKIDIILIAHVIRTEQKSIDGKVNVSRQIVTAGKKPAAKIPAYADEIYHFVVKPNIDTSKESNYIVHTSHVGEDVARTTLPLASELNMGGDRLYDRFVKPAIDLVSQVK